MIEAAMYIALGFFLATLLAAALFPAFYKRAVRLTQEAMKAVNPASYAEVRAAQDYELAKHALALRQVERAVEHERELSVKHRLEAGQLTAELARLKTAHAQELAALTSSLEQAKETAGGKQGEAAKLTAELDRAKDELTRTQQALAAARAEADLLKENQKPEGAAWLPAEDAMALTTITGLESQIATLKAQLAHAGSGGRAQSPSLLQEETEDLKRVVAQLEAELVDTETKYISAQTEVTRLSVLLDQSETSPDERLDQLQRDLKWADDEKARLTALVHMRERGLKHAKAYVGKLQKDLQASPELKAVRSDLAALTKQLTGTPTPEDAAEKKPSAEPYSSGATAKEAGATAGSPKQQDRQAPPQANSKGSEKIDAKTLVSRIVRSSQQQIKPAKTAKTEGSGLAPAAPAPAEQKADRNTGPSATDTTTEAPSPSGKRASGSRSKKRDVA